MRRRTQRCAACPTFVGRVRGSRLWDDSPARELRVVVFGRRLAIARHWPRTSRRRPMADLNPIDAERWKRMSPLLDELFELDAEARAARLAAIAQEDPALGADL